MVTVYDYTHLLINTKVTTQVKLESNEPLGTPDTEGLFVLVNPKK